jgi:uncharacterized protein HemX
MDPINTQNSSGMMNGMPPMAKSERKVGPIVGALIIVLILIIAALYFFGQRLNTAAPVEQQSATQQQQQQSATQASAAASDDVNSIQADLNSTLPDVDYSF